MFFDNPPRRRKASPGPTTIKNEMGRPILYGRTTRGTRAVRRGRVSTSGQIYFVTAIALRRDPVFGSWPTAATASRIANGVFGDSRFLVWVVMPDHFHGLLQLGDQTTLSQAMQWFKGRIANDVNRLAGRRGPLWQHGFHEHALRREEALKDVARYIVLNPVRAGLVRKAGDYPFWNADWV